MTALSLRELIGTFVSDLITGETYAAQASIEFLRTVGFLGGRKSEDDWGPIRFIFFSFAAKGADGREVTRRIRVPLLSLLPVPLQQVDQAEYELFLKVSDVQPAKAPAKGDEKAQVRLLPKAEIMVEIAPFVTEHPSIARMPRVRVKLTMRQSDLPAGLSSSLRRIEQTAGEKS